MAPSFRGFSALAPAAVVALASALAACNGLTADDHAASAPRSTPFVPTPSCARPPSTFSRGAYPANIEDVANAEYGLIGQIAQVHADIPACQTDSTEVDDDTFRIDQIAWPSGDSGFVAPSTISTTSLAAAPGTSMLIMGSGGTFGPGPGEGCTAVYGAVGLDLAQYPNAASDMVRLRTFLADRATYDGLRAAAFVVEGTITAVGKPVYSDPVREPSSMVSVLVTVATDAVVCGTPSTAFEAWRVQYANAGGGGAGGSDGTIAVGSHAFFVVNADTVDGVLTLDGILPMTDLARMQTLRTTTPALSL